MSQKVLFINMLSDFGIDIVIQSYPDEGVTEVIIMPVLVVFEFREGNFIKVRSYE